MRVSCLPDSPFWYPRSAYLRVVVDGVDVTTRCQEADDVEGWAYCIQANPLGVWVVSDGIIQMERLTGSVVISDTRGSFHPQPFLSRPAATDASP